MHTHACTHTHARALLQSAAATVALSPGLTDLRSHNIRVRGNFTLCFQLSPWSGAADDFKTHFAVWHCTTAVKPVAGLGGAKGGAGRGGVPPPTPTDAGEGKEEEEDAERRGTGGPGGVAPPSPSSPSRPTIAASPPSIRRPRRWRRRSVADVDEEQDLVWVRYSAETIDGLRKLSKKREVPAGVEVELRLRRVVGEPA